MARSVLTQMYYFKKNNKFYLYWLEPAGRVSPKFPKSAKSDSFEVANGAVISLLCDAQAFPAPAFRSVHQYNYI